VADPAPQSTGGRLPRAPAYAWAWLQRSRPVLEEVARRLTGQPATTAFVEGLREQLATDAFVQDIVVGSIADVAFNGRLPTRRPAGTAWDRGLVWWAAAIAGVSPAEFEARSRLPTGTQPALFAAPPEAERPPPTSRPATRVPRRHQVPGRAALAAALRELLATAEGDQVPASAVRQLLAELEED
jgi:hypothetical protein